MSETKKRNVYNEKEFIELAMNIHNNNFLYENIGYKTYAKNKITIKCIKHNDIINIYPVYHIKQMFGGCNKCKNENKDKYIKKNKTKFKEITLLENEEKRDINLDNYNKNYLITNYGRCFSKKTGKELSTHINSGYKKVNLYDDTYINKKYSIHYLVYISFNNNYDKNKVIDHIDGNKLNNNLSNLRLTSQSENIINAYNNNDNMYKKNIIQAYDKDNILVKEFININDAIKFISHSNGSSIRNVLKGLYKTAGNYTWKYKDENIIEAKNNMYIEDITDFTSLNIVNDIDFTNYHINKEGTIINTNYNNRKIKIFKNDNNYKRVFLYDKNKKKYQFLVHRLLAKIYLLNGDKYFNDKNFVVNHIDKNRENNNISNLEWITQKENVIHGIGRKIAKIDLKTDEIIKTYTNITDAYKELNIEWNSLISKVCNNEKGRKSIYGFKWKYI
jgi:hypothetical protein